jgi:RNA polymerase sigma factor (sigma-70 family)
MRTRDESLQGDDPQALLDALVVDLDANFADFVRSYEGVVFAVAMRVSGHHPEAEDLTAEAFLRAYRSLRDLPADRVVTLRPRSWLLTILLNTWRNTLREASRRPRQTAVADLPELATGAVSVEEQVTRGETQRELGVFVAELPPSQRAAVVLRHVVDLPMAEVASIMRVPEGTAKSHTSRGLRKLRALMEEEYRPKGSVELPAHRPVASSRKEAR